MSIKQPAERQAVPATDDQRIGKRWGFLILIAAVQLLMMLGTTVVMVSLPALRDEFGLSVAQLQWLVTSYSLGFGGLLLVGGRLADIFGQRRILVAGIVILLVSSLASGFAQDAVVLSITRGVAGFGAALASPAALSMLTRTFHRPRERAISLGIWAAVGATGAALGNVVGGIITALIGWPWIFIINVPVCIVMLVLVPIVVPKLDDGTHKKRNLKVGSAAVATAAMGLLIFALAEVPHAGLGSPTVIISGSIAVAMAALFIWMQARSDDPMLDLVIFKNRSGTGFIMVLLAAGVGVGPYYAGTLFMQDVLGYSSIKAGVLFMLWTAMTIGGSQIASRVVIRIGANRTLTVGFCISMLGTSLFALMAGGFINPDWGIPLAFMVIGTASGTVGVSATNAAMARVEPKYAGIAAGAANGSGQIGGALSTAVVALIIATLAHGVGGGDDVITGQAVSAGVLWSTALALTGVLLSIFAMPRDRVMGVPGRRTAPAPA